MPTELRTLDKLRIEKALDPRLNERDEETIQTYVENLDELPPIDIDQANRILDGVHRFLAHKQAGRREIKVNIINTESELDAVKHAIVSNRTHGIPLTLDEIRRNAIRLCEEGMSNEEISKVVKRHPTVVGKYVKATREKREAELADKVGQLYDIRDDSGNRIYTHKKLAEEIGQSPHRVSDLLDRYAAKKIKGLLKSDSAPHAETQEELNEVLASELGITVKAVERAFKKHGDSIIPPPPPEPEPEPEPELEIEIEPETVEAESAPVLELQEGTETNREEDIDNNATSDTRHKEIQKRLLWLGQMGGLKLWLANDDRKRRYTEDDLADFPNLLTDLPAQNYANAREVIEHIDVLWLDEEGEQIMAAFEVEDSTGIYTGLLRMCDLKLVLDTPRLYAVAPHTRRRKVVREVSRPTFSKLRLREACKYIPYDVLTKTYEYAKQTGSLQSDWQALLDEIHQDL